MTSDRSSGSVQDATAAVGGRWRALRPVERVLLGLLVAVLAVVPALVTGRRSSSYRSEVALAVVSPPPAGAADPVARVRLQVNSRFVQGLMAARAGGSVGALPAGARTVGVRRAADGSIVLSVPGTDPSSARRLADQIASGLADQSRLAAASRKQMARKLAMIDRALRAPGLTAARRRRLVAERRFAGIALQGQRQSAEFAVRRVATTPRRNAVDRVVAGVHAGDATTPPALWAGIAGLLLGLALSGVWLVARDPDVARPPLRG